MYPTYYSSLFEDTKLSLQSPLFTSKQKAWHNNPINKLIVDVVTHWNSGLSMAGCYLEQWLDIKHTYCRFKCLTCYSSEWPSNDTTIWKALYKRLQATAWREFLKITKSSFIPCRITPIWNNPDTLQNKKEIFNFSSLSPSHSITW